MYYPKRRWIAFLGLALVIAGLFMAGRTQWGKGAAAADRRAPAESYVGLRNRMLGLPAAKFNVPATAGRPVAYGVLLDLSLESGTATIVSLNTGDTSMYTSTGGALIGGIGHEACRTASQQFVAAAQAQLAGMRRTDTFLVPPPGVFRFYVLTTEGVYTIEDKAEVLSKGQGPWAPLFRAGDNVITQLRLVSPKK